MKDTLEKKYGFSVALSMVVGIVIGIGIFFKAEQILIVSNLNFKIAIGAWILGGFITILSGLTAAEIAASVTETGGLITYLKRIYGRKVAYIFGWTQAIVYGPAITAIIVYYLSYFTMIFLGKAEYINNSQHIILAFVVYIFVFALNTFTSKSGGFLQTIVTIAKLIPLIMIIIFGLSKGTNQDIFALPVTNEVINNKSPFLLLGMALVPVMFTFDGWLQVGYISGELKNVKKDLPRAIILGLSIITFVYILLNIALIKVLPVEELINAPNGAVDKVANILFGPVGSKLIFGGIVVSAFGGLNGMVLSSNKVPYSLAIMDLFPFGSFFGRVEKRTKQAINSAFLTFFVTILILIAMFITKKVDVFGDIPVAIFWFFYSFLFIGVIILRKKEPNLERPYKVPLYPIIPILSAIGGISIAIYATISNPMYMLISIGIILLGIPFYPK